MKTTFTAKDVHQAFPWIAGTTLFNRIKLGLTPVINKPSGTGEGYQFSLPGLIHVGVIDELMSAGYGKAGVSGTSVEIDFTCAQEFNDSWKTSKEATDQERALRFYEIHNYCCYVDGSIRHSRILQKGNARLKKEDRVFYVAYIPKSKLFPGSPQDGWLSGGLDESGKAFTVFLTFRVDVEDLYIHAAQALGLQI